MAQGGCETLLYMAQELQFDFTKATTVLQNHQGGLGLRRHEARHNPGLIPLCSWESRHKFTVRRRRRRSGEATAPLQPLVM